MTEQKYGIGMVGLGVMGRNLVLNIADHGFAVSGYDKDLSQVQELQKETGSRTINSARDLDEFVKALSTPRTIMLLVPAGGTVDLVIRELIPHLGQGDLIIDGGNSHFKDTDLRAKSLAEKGILYMGVGVSGGEEGARRGPSLMPGGPPEAYQRVRPILEAVSAHVDGSPCVTYLGPRSAGHYVKMVHNGIEYGLMQLIAESYDLMKRGLGMSDEELSVIYGDWNKDVLNGFLMEITSRIFTQVDVRTGKPLIDVILDEARQKGTGMWTSQDAMDLQVPTPVIDAAVTARNLSAMKSERESAGRNIKVRPAPFRGDRDAVVGQLKNALHAAMIITYAQGMAQLQAASRVYEYGLKLEDVARIWRGGCIIRAALLEDIRSAYQADRDLPNLLVDGQLGKTAAAGQKDLRKIVVLAVKLGLPVPCLAASLAYFDGYRSAWLPANLIQAQRDDFGAHTYERVDAKGVFHTLWE
ncbi:MAG TPA: NADP-dependent phosphogluconate dehydrogenase [Anaerolineales bacterium]|nr:NADP-dependent phosphogluconate dehydrogenase [Anaerolineales bacterium]